MSPTRGGFGLIGNLITVAAVLALLLAVFHWVDTHWETEAGIIRGAAEELAKWEAVNRAQRDREAKQTAVASTSLEASRAKTKIVYRTIREQVDKIVEREVYRNICFDADGLLRANAALVGAAGPAPGQPDRTLSRPVSALRWDWGERFAKTD